MGVSPLQLVNLHRNRRYFVIKHMVLSIIFLEDKHKILLHLSIFYEYQQFFQHRICFSIQPPDYHATQSDPWPTLARSTSLFLKGNFAIFYMLAKYVPGDMKYIFTKFYGHISTNNEANRKFVIVICNFSTSLWRFKLKMHCGIAI